MADVVEGRDACDRVTCGVGGRSFDLIDKTRIDVTVKSGIRSVLVQVRVDDILIRFLY